MDTDGVSLKVTNVFKSYGENSIINGLNMYVSSGYIYGLLGPSGCGKSTLLRCILGTIPFDSGCIDLRATYLRDVGYMPQDISLDERLTVKEIFEFYGTLYKMSNEEINFRIDELKFLQLPNMNSYIKNLSGGESRRVSFALCLLHDPKIIILDEPTIGVDPVLRQEIWQEFKNMTKLQSKTIIITTHYIEEANLADCIGFMRKGVLVDEGSPQHILTKYNTESLEESFLIACHNQEMNHIADHNIIQVKTKTPTNKRIKFKNNISFYRVKALLKKNYRIYFRDYILLYTMIILPILQSIIYCSSIGLNFKNMSITIKNDEVNVSDCQSFNINGCIIEENKNQTMSCVVLNYLKSLDYSYTFVEVHDHKAGEMSLNLPNHMAFLYFPKNFTEELTTYIADPDNYANLTYALLTKENFMFRNQIQMDVRNSISYLVKKTLISCSENPKTVSIPMEFNIVYGREVKSYANGTITVFLAL